MTGNDVINSALIKLSSESGRMLETGITLGAQLQNHVNRVIDDLTTIYSYVWSDQYPLGIPTVAGPALSASIYNFPANMIECHDIMLDTGAIDSRKLFGYPLRDFKLKWAAQAYLAMDKPTDWCQLNDNQFQIAPTANSDTYILNLFGKFRPDQITDFTLEITSLPARHQESLIYGAAKRGAEDIKEYPLADIMKGSYLEILGRMITESKRKVATNFVMRPFRAMPDVYQTDYWNNPFVRRSP